MATFSQRVQKEAKRLKRIIVFPEPTDPRILEAASKLQKKGVVIPILVGHAQDVADAARKHNIRLRGLQLLDPAESTLKEPLAKELYKRRRRKGVTLTKAREKVLDPYMFGSLLVRKGVAHGMVAGATRPTKETIKAALHGVGLRKGVKTASSCFFMEFPKETLVFADCGFNIDPDAKQLAAIATETARTATQFGIKPKVAMLSFSTKGSAEHDRSKKVSKATRLAQRKRPDLAIDGELQFDAAYTPEIQKQKAPDSPLKGPATVFVFPDLDSGNNAYKIAERLGGAKAYGPVMQGLAKPVNDLSRGCSAEDVMTVAAITALQAESKDL
ncbi:MAG: phosphate acetyltransferase [Candidatus Woesearchaeota archaeon]